MQILPSVTRDERTVAALRQPEVHLVHGPINSEDRELSFPNKRASVCTEACRLSGCGRLWPRREGDTRASRVEEAGIRATGEEVNVKS